MTWRDLRGTASLWLAAVSLALWLFSVFAPDLFARMAVSGGFMPLRLDVSIASEFPLVPAGLTPLTASFLHPAFGPIIFSGLILLLAGATLEKAIGKVGIVTIYVAGAYAAAVTEYFIRGTSIIPILGAQGAVSAVLGAAALGFGKIRRLTGSYIGDLIAHALSLFAFWVALQWALGWMSGSPEGYWSPGALSVAFLFGLFGYFPLQHSHFVKNGLYESYGDGDDPYEE